MKARGRPAVLVVLRDADVLFPDTSSAPDADGSVDRAATLWLASAHRRLALSSSSGGGGGSGTQVEGQLL